MKYRGFGYSVRNVNTARPGSSSIGRPATVSGQNSAMQQDTLSEILEVEQEIMAMLNAERKRADQWLERTKLKIEQAKQSDLARLAESVAKSEPVAKKAAQDKAAAIVRQAQSLAVHIDRIEEDRLKQVVRQHIAAIIPGATRDH